MPNLNTMMLLCRLTLSFRSELLFIVVLFLALLMTIPAFTQVSLKGQDTTAKIPSSEVSFRVLKTLEGTWNGQVTTEPSNPEINGPIQVKMYVASRGNIIMHEIAPGGMLEPTIIYLDSTRLTMVHYCEAGNRPRLVERNSPDHKKIEFEFLDVSGGQEPVYLSNFIFNLIDENSHTEDWTFTLADGKHLHAHFVLQRTR